VLHAVRGTELPTGKTHRPEKSRRLPLSFLDVDMKLPGEDPGRHLGLQSEGHHFGSA